MWSIKVQQGGFATETFFFFIKTATLCLVSPCRDSLDRSLCPGSGQYFIACMHNMTVKSRQHMRQTLYLYMWAQKGEKKKFNPKSVISFHNLTEEIKDWTGSKGSRDLKRPHCPTTCCSLPHYPSVSVSPVLLLYMFIYFFTLNTNILWGFR